MKNLKKNKHRTAPRLSRTANSKAVLLNTFNKGIKKLKYLIFSVLLFNGLEASADKKIKPYTVLEVSQTASPAEIARAYRRKAIEWHPDRNPAPNANEKMTEINTAYEILKDPVQRQHYDRNSAAQSNQERRRSSSSAYGSQERRRSSSSAYGSQERRRSSSSAYGSQERRSSRSSYVNPDLERILNIIINNFAKIRHNTFIAKAKKSSSKNFSRLAAGGGRTSMLYALLLQQIESHYHRHPPNREAVIFRNIQLLLDKKAVLNLLLTINVIRNKETAERFLSYFSSNTSKEVIDGVLFTAQNLPQDSFSRILQSVIENNPTRQAVEAALDELSKINPEKRRSTLISIAVNAGANTQNRLYALNYTANHFELSENEIRTLQQAQDIETNRRIKRALSRVIQQNSQPNSSKTNTSGSSARSTLISKITKTVSKTLSWRNLPEEEKAQILQEFTSLIHRHISRLNPFNSSSSQEELPQREFTAIAANRSLNIKIRRISLETLNWQNAAEKEKREIIQDLMFIALSSSEDRKLRIRALNILKSARTDLNSIELSLLDRLANNKEEPKAIRSKAKKIVKRGAAKRKTRSSSNRCKQTTNNMGM